MYNHLSASMSRKAPASRRGESIGAVGQNPEYAGDIPGAGRWNADTIRAAGRGAQGRVEKAAHGQLGSRSQTTRSASTAAGRRRG